MAKLTDDDKLDIVIKYGEGIIPSKLARKLSVITKVLRKYREDGIDGIKVKHTKKRYSQEFKNKLMNMIDSGEATDVVAYSNGLDPGTLRLFCPNICGINLNDYSSSDFIKDIIKDYKCSFESASTKPKELFDAYKNANLTSLIKEPKKIGDWLIYEYVGGEIFDYKYSQAIEEYIDYYNNKRIRVKNKGLSPIVYRQQSLNILSL